MTKTEWKDRYRKIRMARQISEEAFDDLCMVWDFWQASGGMDVRERKILVSLVDELFLLARFGERTIR